MEIKRDSKGRFIKGERNTGWKGGRVSAGQGYVRIWKPDHPNNNGGYVLEHRLVMEKKLGRYLKKIEVVHHINGVRDDNREENLVVLTRHIHPSQTHLKGKRRPKEVVEKVRKSLMGHKVSKETREKQRQAKLKNPTRYWLGRKLPPEMIAKSVETRKRNRKQSI